MVVVVVVEKGNSSLFFEEGQRLTFLSPLQLPFNWDGQPWVYDRPSTAKCLGLSLRQDPWNVSSPSIQSIVRQHQQRLGGGVERAVATGDRRRSFKLLMAGPGAPPAPHIRTRHNFFSHTPESPRTQRTGPPPRGPKQAAFWPKRQMGRRREGLHDCGSRG